MFRLSAPPLPPLFSPDQLSTFCMCGTCQQSAARSGDSLTALVLQTPGITELCGPVIHSICDLSQKDKALQAAGCTAPDFTDCTADCTGWYSERWAALGQICKLGFAAVTMSHRSHCPGLPPPSEGKISTYMKEECRVLASHSDS